MQPDGYIKIKDRAKGHHHLRRGEHSSLEVEDVLYRHPAVLAPRWSRSPTPVGETPCAFVELKAHAKVTEREIIDHCRATSGLQVAAPRGFRRAAEDLDGQDPEVPAAAAGEIGLGDRVKEDTMNAPSKTEVEAPYVLREDKDGVATVTLNRGDRMNPLSTAMLSALQAELDRVAKDGRH